LLSTALKRKQLQIRGWQWPNLIFKGNQKPEDHVNEESIICFHHLQAKEKYQKPKSVKVKLNYPKMIAQLEPFLPQGVWL